MTPNASRLTACHNTKPDSHINLQMEAQLILLLNEMLSNRLELINAPIVIEVKFNLLSIAKLVQHNNCVAVLYPKLCLIQACIIKIIKGAGKQKGGLNYLMDVADLGKNTICLCNKLVEYAFLSQSESTIIVATTVNENPDVSIWHQRLGHAPMSKLQHIACIPKMNGKLDCCLTCPLAKFIKLPYSLSKKHRPCPF
ncbi:LOW QUALITY PROTEIN: hypothetical protein Cgig2_028035 [Carnegiea gigantea]|uniref:GAG-pre-integrase domain-containing protein n=1 Tax=Carnegiea gigantea TaxID=171969 RepID=A0A9Q1GZZ5_9CARY|nr:LOW QUALITY PROTEIN: hypothetical protein Cgig2_028035 [Carnegiea gigantea]